MSKLKHVKFLTILSKTKVKFPCQIQPLLLNYELTMLKHGKLNYYKFILMMKNKNNNLEMFYYLGRKNYNHAPFSKSCHFWQLIAKLLATFLDDFLGLLLI
jgi:hypothetical protein